MGREQIELLAKGLFGAAWHFVDTSDSKLANTWYILDVPNGTPIAEIHFANHTDQTLFGNQLPDDVRWTNDSFGASCLIVVDE